MDPERVSRELPDEMREVLRGLTEEYAGFVMRERSWRRVWMQPGEEGEIELSFLNDDMKAALALWKLPGEQTQLFQLALLLSGHDKQAERSLVGKVATGLDPAVAEAFEEVDSRPAVLLIAAGETPDWMRPVLRTDLLTLPEAFFRLADEAAAMIHGGQ